MTTPLAPANTGVLSVYLLPGEQIGTSVVSLEDLRIWALTDLPPAEEADADAEQPEEIPPPPPPPPGPPSPGTVTQAPQPAPVVTPLVTPARIAVVMAAVRDRALGRPIDENPGGVQYRLRGYEAVVRPLSPLWVKVGAPDADLLRALNRYLRLRTPNSTTSNPVFVAGPEMEPAGSGLPYPRAVAQKPAFEYWLNELYGECRDADAQALVRQILQGTENGRPVFRWLPRHDGEVAERAADQAAHVGENRVGKWLEDQDAVDAIRVLVRMVFRIMPPVPELGRAALLPLIGDNAFGFAARLAIAYHATGRAPDAVRGQGTIRTLSIPGRPAELGTGNAWHPYNANQGYTDQAYFRTGQRDNDLQTVVSIAQSPVAALDFPLVQSMLDSTDYLADPPEDDGDYPYDTTMGRVTVRRDQGRVTALTNCWLYLVLADRLHDTKALQVRPPGQLSDVYESSSTELALETHFRNRQGELATNAIEPGHHLMAVRYERVHFGTDREDGMRYRAVEYRNLTGNPAMTEQVSEWLMLFPLCGVKKGLSMSDAQYRDRIAEALAAYQTPPAWLEELKQDVPTGQQTTAKQFDYVARRWDDSLSNMRAKYKDLGGM